MPPLYASIGLKCCDITDATNDSQVYLKPVLGRPNLKVLVEAYVSRIITEEEIDGGVVAQGVEFECGEQLCKVYARREVILCAGLAPHIAYAFS